MYGTLPSFAYDEVRFPVSEPPAAGFRRPAVHACPARDIAYLGFPDSLDMTPASQLVRQ